MPLLWNNKVLHQLSNNYELAKRILLSQLKIYKSCPNKLKMIDSVIKEQKNLGIIEHIHSPEAIPVAFPGYSYLAHMPIFRLEKISSPCRVVFLSNLNEEGANSISHNQAMMSGPSLNRKLLTALLLLRFNSHLLCFDIKKAFLQIELEEIDQYRLLFLWFKNIDKGDFSLVTFKNVRLSFGLRCSPTLLLLALYKILILDAHSDKPEIQILKKRIYHLMYMDNGAISANSSKDLQAACKHLEPIFAPYQFSLQQYATNDIKLQDDLDQKMDERATPSIIKLLGIKWDRSKDLLCTPAMTLSPEAKTKRQILRSIAENFDPNGFNMPVMNRARLFLHKLQVNRAINWDTILDEQLLHEWKLIAKQVNASKPLEIPRYVGSEKHNYRLIAFTDSSKQLYGVTIYLHNLDTNQVSFLLAKNRVITKQLANKSIPTLEFHAAALGAEILIDTYRELVGRECVMPIKIQDLHLYTDSYVALNWLNSYVQLDKMKNLSVFTKNRLAKIIKLCEEKPITFKFVVGAQNPADCITREISAKKLKKSNFLKGPKFLTQSTSQNLDRQDLIEVLIPDPAACENRKLQEISMQATCNQSQQNAESQFHQFVINRYSTFRRVFNCYMGMFKFINILKTKLKQKFPDKIFSFQCKDPESLDKWVMTYIINKDQQIQFPEVFDYFRNPTTPKCKIPPLVSQYNLCLDSSHIIKVNSKFVSLKYTNFKEACPVLLSRNSRLSELIVADIHEKLSHASRYTVLTEVRKKYWIPRCYSLVKTITENCFMCKRQFNRAIITNQNSYRDFRADPPSNPFQYIYIDHMGPYKVTLGKNTKMKVWVLVICCLWSRAINLEICYSLNMDSFLKALQSHILTHGLFELCLSDMGSQIVSGANKIKSFILNDSEVHHFFKHNNIKTPEFDQYFKGKHELGSLVEICVKLSKRLIFGSIRNLVFDVPSFNFIIKQTINLINRRPIAFRESLRDNNIYHLPEVITPEQLIYGRTLTSMNIIPELQDIDSVDLVNLDKDIPSAFDKLVSARQRLIKLYNGEFLQNLITQATNQTNRYMPRKHHKLKEGDVVLLKTLC